MKKQSVITLPEKQSVAEYKRVRPIQITMRLTEEEEKMLWACQFKRGIRNRAAAALFYFFEGMKATGDLDVKKANQFLEDARQGRHYDNTPTLNEKMKKEASVEG